MKKEEIKKSEKKYFETSNSDGANLLLNMKTSNFPNDEKLNMLSLSINVFSSKRSIKLKLI